MEVKIGPQRQTSPVLFMREVGGPEAIVKGYEPEREIPTHRERRLRTSEEDVGEGEGRRDGRKGGRMLPRETPGEDKAFKYGN